MPEANTLGAMPEAELMVGLQRSSHNNTPLPSCFSDIVLGEVTHAGFGPDLYSPHLTQLSSPVPSITCSIPALLRLVLKSSVI